MELNELYARLVRKGTSTAKDEAEWMEREHKPRQKPRQSVGSRPRKPEHVERRRMWAARGKVPPRTAALFTPGEQAALAVVAWEAQRGGDCRKSHAEIARMAGVSATVAKDALREARRLGLISVEERRVSRTRNLPNIVRIISPEWRAWLRLGGGVGFAPPVSTFKKERVAARVIAQTRAAPEGQGKEANPAVSSCCARRDVRKGV